MKLARRKDETETQFRSRLSHAKAIGEGRDVINPFRQQHNDFETGFVKDPESHGQIGVRRRASQIPKLKERLRLSEDETSALIKYRQAWDKCEYSKTRSCCDFSVRGEAPDGWGHLDATRRLNQLTAAIRPLCKMEIFKMIICKDYSVSYTAKDILGSGKPSNIDMIEGMIQRAARQLVAWL